MIRLAAALVLAAAPAAAAAALDMPAGANRAAEAVEPLGSYAVPVAPWRDGGVETVAAEGHIRRAAWQLPSTATTLQILEPLRAQLADQGYEVIFECETAGCGGFDFRFQTEVLPEPEMHVDLGDFRFLAARRTGAEGGPAYITLLVSRSSAVAYVQTVRVGPLPEPGEPAAVLTSKSPPATVAAAGARAPGDLGMILESMGRTVLDDLSFATGSSRLAEGEFASLTALADYLRANPGRRVTLVGHSDAEGGLASNIALSRARAQAVRERLVTAYDLPRAQIEADGVGYLMPLASNLTDQGRSANRRVEVVLSSVE